MDIRVISKRPISARMERWQIQLPVERFREFGFLLESMEGVGLHRRSLEADNLMEVDVSAGFVDELEALIRDLAGQP